MNMLTHITELRRAAAELEDLTARVQRQIAALAELHAGKTVPEPDHSPFPTRQLPNGLCVPITPAGFDLLFSLVEHQHALLNPGATDQAQCPSSATNPVRTDQATSPSEFWSRPCDFAAGPNAERHGQGD